MKLNISNIQNSTFVRTTGGKLRRRLEYFKVALKEEWRFEIFAPITSHVNQKIKKNREKSETENFEIQNSNFVRYIEKKIWGKFETL